MKPLLLAVLALSACTAAPSIEVPERRAPIAMDLPPMKVFPVGKGQPVRRSNRDLARDFLDLSFQMESGRTLPYMTRFTGPITIAVAPGAPGTLGSDLDKVLTRFRNEARIDIRRAAPGGAANIWIETVARQDLQRYVPQAACFVVPRVTGWADFRRNRRGPRTDWSTLRARQAISVFIPNDVSPQEVRDCLHEELAQALGPLNDLYRLSDSVFNDDNFHTVLTGFDMLMLRVYYDPALRNGMTRAQAAAVVPGVLARLNPAGERIAPNPLPRTPRAWIDAVESALGPRNGAAARQSAAKRAVLIARREGWNDTRSAFGYFALGKLSMNIDPELAVESFMQAARIYRALPDHAVQSAHASMQLAAFALSAGRPEVAIRLADESLPAARASENAALLSTLLMIKAAALGDEGQLSDARALRVDSLGWARYGFGSENEVRDRVMEIAALSPKGSGR